MKFARSGLLPVVLGLLLSLPLNFSPALAQDKMSAEDEAIYRNMLKSTGIDPDMVMGAKKRVDAVRSLGDLIHYHIVGDYQGRTNVAGGSNWIAYADVTDKVEIDLDWKLSESKLLGTPSFKNTKSVVSNPRNPEPSCSPPLIKGDYEHYELLSIKDGLSGGLELQVQTRHPVVEVAQFCTGSRKSLPASQTTEPEEMNVLSPVMLSMRLPDSDDLRISVDKKSLIQKKNGWTWTFTPSGNK